ncbi:MAG: hypothetical protein KF847_08215 [Pirellulales bacterium]|nr:hypothetical protein [Pirellulales bacterium]
MSVEIYRYRFVETIATEDIDASLLLAVWACEALHGECQVRLDAAHFFDAEARQCVIDAATDVGRNLNRLFIGFIGREFGPESFIVERAADPVPHPQEVAA